MKKHTFLIILVIAYLLPQQVESQVSEQDSLALVSIYNATSGSDWTDNTGWLDGPVADWYGVTLEANRVTRLILESNNLTGSLHEAIGDLTNLNLLNVGSNNLSGEIPASIGNCEQLDYLVVRGNAFTGPIPMELANCKVLRTIWAINNQFSGGFPEVFLHMPGLEELRIGGNNFDGNIPAAIDTLVGLIVFEIAANDFSGTMPSVTNLIDLIVLEVWGNELEGDMSEILGYHPDMVRMRCSGNYFTGCMSDVHFNPSEFARLEIQSNRFNCIGDFSAFVDTGVFTRLACGRNKIPFEFLEKNAGVETYSYSPQDSLLTPEFHELKDGDTLVIDSGTRGVYTSYSWYKDYELIANETEPTLEINGFVKANEGIYHMSATNSLLPDLTLYRHNVEVRSDELSALQNLPIEYLMVYPNPASDQIFLDNLNGEGLVKILDMNGKIMIKEWVNFNSAIPISKLTTGLYVMDIQSDGKLYKSKFVKL